MDAVLLDYGFPEASRPVYKKAVGVVRARYSFCAPRNPSLLLKPFICSFALLVPARRRSGPREADCLPAAAGT
jgi:hypothetical protein